MLSEKRGNKDCGTCGNLCHTGVALKDVKISHNAPSTISCHIICHLRSCTTKRADACVSSKKELGTHVTERGREARGDKC